tara:strand:+ start:7734 stop:8003 length:270 start_codon:yes stop_codon:yes gene_type:complete
MNVDSRENSVTLTIDLSSRGSVIAALEYIDSNKSGDGETATWHIVTSKVKVIKALRAYGKLVSSGTMDCGLKDAKRFYENTIEDIIIRD